MSDNIVFGKKETFLIEIGETKSLEKFKLCFWILGRKIGSFTKSGELHYSIKAFENFIENRDKYYLPIFETMTPTRIYHYLIIDLFSLGKSNKEEKKAEYKKRKSFNLFFGPQFSNDGCSLILLYKDFEVIFIYTPPEKTKAESFTISYNIFYLVVNEYSKYYYANKLTM